MRKIVGIFLIALIFCVSIFGVYTHASVRRHMTWEITGLVDGVLCNQTCVNEMVEVTVRDRNTGEPLDRVYVDVCYGGNKVMDLVTNDLGVIMFTPENEGVYELSMEKSRYVDGKTEVYVPLCVVATTTTVTSTSTTSPTTSTTSPPTSSTSTSSTTTSSTTSSTSSTTTSSTTSTTSPSTSSTQVPGESCGDGIQNQDELGVDCGGPCKPCPSNSTRWLILAAAAVILMAAAVYLIRGGRMKGGKKTRKEGDKKELKGVHEEVNKGKKKKRHPKKGVKKGEKKVEKKKSKKTGETKVKKAKPKRVKKKKRE